MFWGFSKRSLLWAQAGSKCVMLEHDKIQQFQVVTSEHDVNRDVSWMSKGHFKTKRKTWYTQKPFPPIPLKPNEHTHKLRCHYNPSFIFTERLLSILVLHELPSYLYHRHTISIHPNLMGYFIKPAHDLLVNICAINKIKSAVVSKDPISRVFPGSK